MKNLVIYFLILIILPLLSFADEPFGVLYGSIRLAEGVPHPGIVRVNLQCGEEEDWSLFSAIDVKVPGTFKSNFRLIKGREKCTLIFYIREEDEYIKIFKEITLIEKPRRYDFIIDKEGDDYVVKRR